MHYLIKYAPTRPTFVDDATDEEMAIISEHFDYLKELLEKGKLILAGRTDDAHLGIAVIEVESEGEAEEIFNGDPAIKSGIFSGELHIYHLALLKD
jgi:uncharacterized protein YciI